METRTTTTRRAPATFASSRSEIERAIQKRHLRGMNQHLFEKYENIFTSNESIRWPEKTEVNEDYLNEFKSAPQKVLFWEVSGVSRTHGGERVGVV